MESTSYIYQPSGKIGSMAWVFFAIEALLVFPLLGILYAFFLNYIPIVYLNVLVVVGYAMIIGVMVYPIVRFGKVRGKQGEVLFGILLALVASYWQWCAHLTFVYGMDEHSSFFTPGDFNVSDFLYLASHPSALWSNMTYIGGEGTWGIGSGVVKGTFLWIIWFIEFAILCFGGIVTPRGWSKLPFSEQANQWYNRRALPKKLQLHRGISKFVEGFKSQDLTELGKTPIVDSAMAEYTELVMFESSGEDTAYVAFYNQQIETDEKGNKKKTYTRTGDFYLVTPAMNQALTEFFG